MAWSLESVQKYGYVHFNASVPTTYTALLSGQVDKIMNSIIYADELVTIATDYRDYDFYRSIKMHGRAKFFILGEKYSFYAKDIPQVQQQASLDYNPVEMEPVPFNLCKTYSIPANSDSFNAAGSITSYTHGAQASVPANSLTGIYTQIDIGETISAHVTTTLNTAERVGVVVRCSNGYYYISKGINTTGAWQMQYKQRGGAYQGPVAINMPDNTLLSYTAGKASIGVMVQSKNSFMFTMNEVSTGLPFKTGTLGEIMDVGFVASTTAQADVLKITGLHIYRSAHGVLGKPPIDIAFYGDSEVADFVGSFTKYIPGLIDGRMGTRTVTIPNAAVAGQSFGQQLAFLKANPPGAQIVCMVAGTNEAQGGISADFFVNTVKDFCDFCIGRGQTPMWVEPWMWYPKEFTNGNGQTTIGNYDNAAELREAGKRIMASYGDQAICVTTTHQLFAPLPKYTNDYPQIDPHLRDNLHQSELSYRLYAEIVASALLKWLVKVDKTPASLPDWYLGQFITTTNSRISKGLLSGTFGATTALSNNVILCQLPRWNIPGYQLDAPVTWFNSTSNTYGAGRLSISTAGEVRVYGASGATLIYVHAKW